MLADESNVFAPLVPIESPITSTAAVASVTFKVPLTAVACSARVNVVAEPLLMAGLENAAAKGELSASVVPTSTSDAVKVIEVAVADTFDTTARSFTGSMFIVTVAVSVPP